MTYVDASVLLRPLLDQEAPLDPRRLHPGVTSRIARVEVFRALERVFLQGHIRERSYLVRLEAAHAMLKRIAVAELERGILDRAEGSMPTPLKSVDAIHLATAMHFRDVSGDPLLIATHDRALAAAARANGFEVVGI